MNNKDEKKQPVEEPLFVDELEDLIRKHRLERQSGGVSAGVLAEYLVDSLQNFNRAISTGGLLSKITSPEETVALLPEEGTYSIDYIDTHTVRLRKIAF